MSFYAGYPYTYSRDKPCPQGIHCCSYSLLFMVPLYLVPALALLFFYVNTFRRMCAVPNMAVFCSFNVMVSRYVFHVFSEWFGNVPSRSNYYYIILVFTFLHYYYYYYYYYLLQLSFRSVAVVLTLVTNKNNYT